MAGITTSQNHHRTVWYAKIGSQKWCHTLLRLLHITYFFTYDFCLSYGFMIFFVKLSSQSYTRMMWSIITFPYNKPTRCTISVIYFGRKLYMFRTVSLSIIRSFSLYTHQWYMSYRFADSFRAGSGWNQFHPRPARELSANLYDIYHWCVYNEKLLMMDRGTVRNM